MAIRVTARSEANNGGEELKAIKGQNRFLKLFMIYITAIIVGVVLAVVSEGSKIYAVVFYLITILGITLYIKREECNWRQWFAKPQHEGDKRIVISTIILLVLIAFTIVLKSAVWVEGIKEVYKFNMFIFIGTCLLAPLIEEIACRGIIVDLLKEKHGDLFTVIVSSVIFYIIHGDLMNISALMFGVIAGWMVLKTKSIIPGAVMHFGWNIVIYFSPVIAEQIAEMI